MSGRGNCSGRWLVASGQLPVAGCRLPVAGCQWAVAGWWMVGSWTPVLEGAGVLYWGRLGVWEGREQERRVRDLRASVSVCECLGTVFGELGRGGRLVGGNPVFRLMALCFGDGREAGMGRSGAGGACARAGPAGAAEDGREGTAPSVRGARRDGATKRYNIYSLSWAGWGRSRRG